MRWFWIDRFVEFQSGRRAVAIKNVSLVEEAVDNYLPHFPMLPASVMVEGLAQTGGLLVGEHSQFRERVVLAKLGKAVFHRPAVPGDQLTYCAEVEEINPQGAIVKGTVSIAGELVAEVELVFAHLDDRFPSQLFSPQDLLQMLRLFRVYEIAVDADGHPLELPPELASIASELARE